jgi:hypothetical protein
VWDGIAGGGGANDGEERRCIDELLRKKWRQDEACVGIQDKEIRRRFYGGEQAEWGMLEDRTMCARRGMHGETYGEVWFLARER